MIDKLKHIEANGEKYPMAFTLNIMEKVQEEYGSMQEWTEALQPTKTVVDEVTGKEEKVSAEPKIKDVIWTFREFINEGIEIENEDKNENKQLLTHKQAGRLITNIKEVTKAMTELTVKSLKTENPNAQTTQNQTNQ